MPPFAAGLVPPLSPPTVSVTAVTPLIAGAKKFDFDVPFTTPPSCPDPVFQVSVDGISWFAPLSMIAQTPTSVSFSYMFGGWGAVMWRILTPPLTMDWLPSTLTVPVSGSIPYP